MTAGLHIDGGNTLGADTVGKTCFRRFRLFTLKLEMSNALKGYSFSVCTNNVRRQLAFV